MAQSSSGVSWDHPSYPARSQQESDLCSLCVQQESSQGTPFVTALVSLSPVSHIDPPGAAKGRV